MSPRDPQLCLSCSQWPGLCRFHQPAPGAALGPVHPGVAGPGWHFASKWSQFLEGGLHLAAPPRCRPALPRPPHTPHGQERATLSWPITCICPGKPPPLPCPVCSTWAQLPLPAMGLGLPAGCLTQRPGLCSIDPRGLWIKPWYPSLWCLQGPGSGVESRCMRAGHWGEGDATILPCPTGRFPHISPPTEAALGQRSIISRAAQAGPKSRGSVPSSRPVSILPGSPDP